MYQPSPAVEWLETDSESPYNLSWTKIVDRYGISGGGILWEGPHIWYRARPATAGSHVQPMFRLKDDLPDQDD